MPSEAKNKSSLSKKVSLLRAAKIPNTIPKIVAKLIAANANKNVAGSVSAIIELTFLLV
jgi:hypothetical protein